MPAFPKRDSIRSRKRGCQRVQSADGAGGLMTAMPTPGGTTQKVSDSKRPRSLSIRQLSTLGDREPCSPMMMYDSSGQAQWRSRRDGLGNPLGWE